MVRYDDGKRGFGVTDALSLSDAWRHIQKMLHAGALQFPQSVAHPTMMEFFRETYPSDQLERALNSQLQSDEAERTVIEAIQSGLLPLWIAPANGTIAERQVAAGSLLDFGRESLISGCYLAHGDTENLVYGYPLFVKIQDWVKFTASLGKVQHPFDAAIEKPVQTRRKPGPVPDPDWPVAIVMVTNACRNAGYTLPLKRGEKAAIQQMLLNAMAEKNKHPSDDTARKYAADVIAGLPDNSAE